MRGNNYHVTQPYESRSNYVSIIKNIFIDWISQKERQAFCQSVRWIDHPPNRWRLQKPFRIMMYLRKSMDIRKLRSRQLEGNPFFLRDLLSENWDYFRKTPRRPTASSFELPTPLPRCQNSTPRDNLPPTAVMAPSSRWSYRLNQAMLERSEQTTIPYAFTMISITLRSHSFESHLVVSNGLLFQVRSSSEDQLHLPLSQMRFLTY